MKILLVIPGSGDQFFCSNCLRDNFYAQALRNAGHDVVVMPLYLPLTYPSFQADTPLFFPATSFYVAQKFFGKGKMPHLFEKILNSPSALRWAASLSGTTSAKGLEQMTLSMIKGEGKTFEQQAQKLIHWIQTYEKPDIIHISTSLLIGIAKVIKNHLNIPVVCSLKDEEIWLDSLDTQYANEGWKAIEKNAKYINRFVTSSNYYKSVVLNKIPEIKEIDVIYPGVATNKYQSSVEPAVPTIGFFYRMNYENGLDLLAQAFVNLKKEGSVPHLKLKIGGGYNHENKSFIKNILHILKPYKQDVIWCDHYTLESHFHFYSNISLICNPLRFNEAFGLYICEAFAAGKPAVMPNAGSFSEIVEDAGLLFAPNAPEHLTETLRKILTNKDIYEKCKENALRLSKEKYNDETTVKGLLKVYDRAH